MQSKIELRKYFKGCCHNNESQKKSKNALADTVIPLTT